VQTVDDTACDVIVLTLTPEIREPTTMVPVIGVTTVSVPDAIEPVNSAEPVRKGAKDFVDDVVTIAATLTVYEPTPPVVPEI